MSERHHFVFAANAQKGETASFLLLGGRKEFVIDTGTFFDFRELQKVKDLLQIPETRGILPDLFASAFFLRLAMASSFSRNLRSVLWRIRIVQASLLRPQEPEMRIAFATCPFRFAVEEGQYLPDVVVYRVDMP